MNAKYKHNGFYNMDFLQSLRVSQLSDQLTHWLSPGAVANHYGSLERRALGDKLDDFVVQKWQNGYITFEDGTLKYEDIIAGKTFVMRRHFNNHDHVCFEALSTEGSSSGKFRCSKLDFREIITLGSTEFEYLEFTAPNGEYGINPVSNYFFNSISSRSFLRDKINKIDQITYLIKACKKIAVEQGTGIPNFSIIIWDDWTDSVGSYWPEIIDWNFSVEESIRSCLGVVTNITELNVRNEQLTATEADDLLAYARTSWQ